MHIPLDHVEDKTFPSDIIIDNERHAIIVHPDRLISATAVAESFMCTRKSVLQAKFKSIGDYTEALVHGNLIHRLLQQCLTQTDFSTAGMRKKVQAIVSSSLEELMAIDQSDDTAIDLLNKQIPDLQKFLYTYLGKNPKPKATLARDKGPDAQKLLGCKTISISRVLHVEDHIWSPTYGLKGMIDAAVEMTFWPNSKTLIVPLEIKTGKSSRFVSHRAQTALYSLLMSDRYGICRPPPLLHHRSHAHRRYWHRHRCLILYKDEQHIPDPCRAQRFARASDRQKYACLCRQQQARPPSDDPETALLPILLRKRRLPGPS